MNDQDIIEGHAIAVREEPAPQQNLALFGTNDPVAVIAQATRVADALKAVVVAKKLVVNIQGKEYPMVEAWQTLAVMLGIAAVCEWTREIEGGWEARVVAQRNGFTIAAAEAQCLKSEKSKRGWEDYAIRSMAQTRAISKALRSVLGFVMVLAGYQATPAEEMPTDAKTERANGKQPPKRADADSEADRERGRTAVRAFARDNHILDTHRWEISQSWFGQASTKPQPEDGGEPLSTPMLRRLYALLAAYVRNRDSIDGLVFEDWLAAEQAKAVATHASQGGAT